MKTSKPLDKILVNSYQLVIAKIETKAVSDEELEKIVLASDGIMIARGDMAYEVAPEVVPIVQRKTIALCRKHGKISIVANQTMGSMTDNPQPSRAEVSDVANAVIQGTDVVMLSDESATGNTLTKQFEQCEVLFDTRKNTLRLHQSTTS